MWNNFMLLIIILTTLSGCASTNKTVYPVLVYSEIYDGRYIEYYKRNNGTHFMRYKLNSGVVKEMDMFK